jgi:hypothetical protein
MDYIKINVKERRCEVINWIQVIQDRVQWWAPINMIINICVSYKAGNFLTRRATISLSRRTLFHGVGNYKQATY